MRSIEQSGDKKRCRIEACGKPIAAWGFCWMHYMRARRNGDAHTTRRVYRKHHECRYCGTRVQTAFYAKYKGICKICSKLKRMGELR